MVTCHTKEFGMVKVNLPVSPGHFGDHFLRPPLGPSAPCSSVSWYPPLSSAWNVLGGQDER